MVLRHCLISSNTQYLRLVRGVPLVVKRRLLYYDSLMRDDVVLGIHYRGLSIEICDNLNRMVRQLGRMRLVYLKSIFGLSGSHRINLAVHNITLY